MVVGLDFLAHFAPWGWLAVVSRPLVAVYGSDLLRSRFRPQAGTWAGSMVTWGGSTAAGVHMCVFGLVDSGQQEPQVCACVC